MSILDNNILEIADDKVKFAAKQQEKADWIATILTTNPKYNKWSHVSIGLQCFEKNECVKKMITIAIPTVNGGLDNMIRVRAERIMYEWGSLSTRGYDKVVLDKHFYRPINKSYWR